MSIAEDTVSLSWSDGEPPRRNYNFVWNDEEDVPTIHRTDTNCNSSYDSDASPLGVLQLIAERGADICGQCCRGVFRFIVEKEGPLLKPMAIIETKSATARILYGVGDGRGAVGIQRKTDDGWVCMAATKADIETREDYASRFVAGAQKAHEYNLGVTGIEFVESFDHAARCRTQLDIPDEFFD